MYLTYAKMDNTIIYPKVVTRYNNGDFLGNLYFHCRLPPFHHRIYTGRLPAEGAATMRVFRARLRMARETSDDIVRAVQEM